MVVKIRGELESKVRRELEEDDGLVAQELNRRGRLCEDFLVRYTTGTTIPLSGKSLDIRGVRYNERRGGVRLSQSNEVSRARRDGRGKRIIIRNTAPHASFLEFDADPHPIRARAKPSLVFKLGGKIRNPQSVYHPGHSGYRFMESAALAAFKPNELAIGIGSLSS